MQTDWVLIERVARELEDRLRGARVEDVGLLADGRVAIAFRLRGAVSLLVVDLFAPSPLLTLEQGELGIIAEPGFVRALARSLRGMVLARAAARRHDRLVRLTFASRSRFGVGDELELYVELVPRFGNLVLVKDGTIVVAQKEFSASENPRRAVQVGAPYALPPVPAAPRTIAKHPAGSVLEYFSRLREQHASSTGNARVASRRRGILRQLDNAEAKLRSEIASLEVRRRRAEERDALRSEGEEIFATLHTLDETNRESAKERAAELFAQYKKLTKSLPHIDLRRRAAQASLVVVETLRWEAERAADEDLDAVEEAMTQQRPRHRAPPAPRASRQKRPLLELLTPNGSRIVVGRSPIENADLTFRFARPNDLWFHAQRIPGAHVILARGDREGAPDEDLEIAASLAAFYSRAKDASSVPVDYTQRKYVRKQRAAPPGLVWYTNAKTILVEPRPIDRLR
jgi:predicted ribosome quality control (RQC) complex YloA/Tae2 family protein